MIDQVVDLGLLEGAAQMAERANLIWWKGVLDKRAEGREFAVLQTRVPKSDFAGVLVLDDPFPTPAPVAPTQNARGLFNGRHVWMNSGPSDLEEELLYANARR